MTSIAPSAVALTDVRRHVGVIRSLRPLAVESAPDRWAYAVSVPLTRQESNAFPLRVTANVVVEAGVLGCLIVANDWTTLLGTPSPSIGVGRSTVELTWEQGDVAQLVFRNHGMHGRPCSFVVEGVWVSPLPEGVAQHSLQMDEIMESDGRALSVARLHDAFVRHEAAQAS